MKLVILYLRFLKVRGTNFIQLFIASNKIIFKLQKYRTDTEHILIFYFYSEPKTKCPPYTRLGYKYKLPTYHILLQEGAAATEDL